MDDDGDLHEEILHIEAHIEEFVDVIESCRKFIFISKVAIGAGGTLILAIIIGAVGLDPTAMIGALAAVIGGTVVAVHGTADGARISCRLSQPRRNLTDIHLRKTKSSSRQ